MNSRQISILFYEESKAGQTLTYGGDVCLQYLLKLHKITQVGYLKWALRNTTFNRGGFPKANCHLSALVNTLSVIKTVHFCNLTWQVRQQPAAQHKILLMALSFQFLGFLRSYNEDNCLGLGGHKLADSTLFFFIMAVWKWQSAHASSESSAAP